MSKVNEGLGGKNDHENYFAHYVFIYKIVMSIINYLDFPAL